MKLLKKKVSLIHIVVQIFCLQSREQNKYSFLFVNESNNCKSSLEYKYFVAFGDIYCTLILFGLMCNKNKLLNHLTLSAKTDIKKTIPYEHFCSFTNFDTV